MTTRPINHLLPKIVKKENELKEKGVIPEVVVIGAGAAGTELSFAFKARWSKFFGQDIKVTLLCATPQILPGSHPSTVKVTLDELKRCGIDVTYNSKVKSIGPDHVELRDGTKIQCTVPIWATGADPQEVSAKSDLELLKGYFRVNDFLQSTSHPNVFAGGDCITMETYADQENFPPKAGVYAVREGPFIAQNIARYIKQQELLRYVP